MHRKHLVTCVVVVAFVSACRVGALLPLDVANSAPTDSSQGSGGVLPTSNDGVPGTALQTTADTDNGLRATLDSYVLSVGDEKALAPTLRTDTGLLPTAELLWSSSNESVAAIDPVNGTLKAVGKGSAIITAFFKARPDVKVAVTAEVVERPLVSLIRISPATPTIVVGNKLTLTAEVRMADGQVNGNVNWSSSDSTVATVNTESGVVNPLREGRVTIVASYGADGRYKGLAEVTIVNAAPASPSPSVVVFGPGATPLPAPTTIASLAPTPRPTARPTPIPTPTPPPTPTPEPKGRWLTQSTGYTGTIYSVCMLDKSVGFALGGGSPRALLKTTNGGVRWTSVPLPSPMDTSTVYGLWFVDQETGWIGGREGKLYKTEDGGATWKLSLNGSSSIINIRFKDSTTGVMTGLATYMTDDAGATWTKQATGDEFLSSGEYVTLPLHGIAFKGDYTWLVGTNGIYRHTPTLGWIQARAGVSKFSSYTSPIFESAVSFGTEMDGWAYISTRYVSGDELLHSTDGGLTWAEVTPKQSNGSSLSLGGSSCAIAFADERNGWLAIDNRILATNDGGTTWSETTIAGISRIYALHMIDAENGWGAADNGTILRYAVF